MRLFLLFLSSMGLLSAQNLLPAATSLPQPTPGPARTTVRLHQQEVFVGNLRQYVVSICNTGEISLGISASQVWSAVTDLGMNPATNANVLRACEEQVGISWERKTLLVCEVASLAGTMLLAGDVIKIEKETAQGKALNAAIPLSGAIIRIATTVAKKSEPNCDFKEDFPRLPNYFQLGVGSCIDYTLYGTAIPGR